MKVLQKIAETYVDNGEDSPELDSAIEKLRAGISKEQKSLLLKIMDEYIDRIDYAAYRNFKHGFIITHGQALKKDGFAVPAVLTAAGRLAPGKAFVCGVRLL